MVISVNPAVPQIPGFSDHSPVTYLHGSFITAIFKVGKRIDKINNKPLPGYL